MQQSGPIPIPTVLMFKGDLQLRVNTSDVDRYQAEGFAIVGEEPPASETEKAEGTETSTESGETGKTTEAAETTTSEQEKEVDGKSSASESTSRRGGRGR